MVDEHAMEKALDDFRRAVALDPDENGMHARYRSAQDELRREICESGNVWEDFLERQGHLRRHRRV